MGQWIFALLLSALLPLGGRAQTWQWATGPYAVTGSTYTRASINSMVTDGAGNTYVAGSFAYKFDVGSLTPISSVGTTDDLDAFVAKLDNAGTWLWVAHIGGIRDEWISDIALDGNGNLAVVGNYKSKTASFYNGSGTAAAFSLYNIDQTSSSSNATTDFFVARLSAGGSWLQNLDLGTSANEFFQAVAVDGAGNAVVAGNFYGSLTLGGTTINSSNGTCFVARVTTAGVFTQLVGGGGANDGSVVQDMTLDAAGTVNVVGYYFGPSIRFGTATPIRVNAGGTSNTTDGFVARLSSGGTWTASQRAGGSANDYFFRAAAAPNGEVAVGGTFFSTTVAFGPSTVTNANSFGGTADGVVARLNPAGIQWTQATSGGGAENDIVAGVAFDGAGNLVVGGVFRATAMFGSANLTSAGFNDAFVGRVNPAGSWSQVIRCGGNGDDNLNCLALRADGRVTIAGNYDLTAAFGSISLLSVGSPRTGPFVARSAFLLDAPTLLAEPQFSLYPNPAHGQVQLELVPEPTALPLVILDALGRVVHSETLLARATTATLDVASLPAGLYTVRCGGAARRLVVE